MKQIAEALVALEAAKEQQDLLATVTSSAVVGSSR